MTVPAWTESSLRSDDGTRLAVQVAGAGPLVVLANGLGGSLRAWGPFLARFGTDHRVASWDYRGLYGSAPPARRSAVAVEDHAADLGAVLRWLGGGPCLLLGWSMGVQVAVQHALDHPASVRGLVLVAGAPGDPLAGVLHTPLARRVVPPLTYAVEAGAGAFGLGLRALTAWKGAPRLLRGAGVVAPSADLETFGALARSFARLDWHVYMRTIRAMAVHDAWPRLAQLRVPTLVVGGDRDLFLPIQHLAAMAAAVPGAELEVVHGGTHYLPVEFPAELDARVRRFVAERIDRTVTFAPVDGGSAGGH
jgi:pimeloyl-ACP methyl ester carboxylesterase